MEATLFFRTFGIVEMFLFIYLFFIIGHCETGLCTFKPCTTILSQKAKLKCHSQISEYFCQCNILDFFFPLSFKFDEVFEISF